jgi:hypothetical protein
LAKNKLHYRQIDSRYLINHFIEICVIAGIKHSTIDFRKKNTYTVKGRNLIDDNQKYHTDFYPFFLNRIYNVIEFKFKKKKDRSKILFIQDRRTKHISVLHLIDKNKYISVADGGKFIIYQDDVKTPENEESYFAKRIRRVSKGDDIE